MGRYFNDDMTEDQNDDYDAYLEHYGIPKEKWDATVRARFDQLHHKTEDSLRKAKLHANSIGKQAYRSISDGAKKFGSKANKQITGAGQKVKDHFTKPKFRGIEEGRDAKTGKKSIYFHYDTDAEHNVEQAAKTVEKGVKKIKKTGKNIKKGFEKKTTYTTEDGKKIRGIYTPSGFITIEKPKKKRR